MKKPASLDYGAILADLGPLRDNSAYLKASRELRKGAEKAEAYFGHPVKIVNQTIRTTPGGYSITYHFAPDLPDRA